MICMQSKMQQLAQCASGLKKVLSEMTMPVFGLPVGAAQPMLAGYGAADMRMSERVTNFIRNAEPQVEAHVQHSGITWNVLDFTWQMDVLVTHAEVPINKSCQDVNYESRVCGDKRNCITCQALACLKERHAGGDARPVVDRVMTHVASNQHMYDNMTPKEAADSIAEFLVGLDRGSRKILSHCGAVRVPKERAMQILASSESLNNYWCIITGTADNKVAYMMYHDYGNTIMGNWATDCQIAHIDNLNMEHKADIVECMLGLGWVHCNSLPDAQRILSVVTRLVPWIENGLDQYMTAQNGVVPVRNWHPQQAQPAAEQAPVPVQPQLVQVDLGPVLQAINDLRAQVADLRTEVANAAPAHMEQEVKATVNVPIWDEAKKRAANGFLNNHGNACWLQRTDLLELPKVKQQKYMDSLQLAIFRCLRDYKVMSDDGSDTLVDVPYHDSWVPWGYVKKHINHDDVFGDCTDEQFWTVVLYTVNKNDPKHSSYMVADIVHNERQPDGTMQDQHYVMLKIRELPYQPKGNKGYGGGWGDNKRGRWGS